MSKLKKLLKNGYNYRYLLNQLVTKSIKLKYRRSYLGVVWSLIEPLLTMIVLTFVFGTLLGRGDKFFPIYVLSGRLIYSFFSAGTKGAMKSIRNNSGMIKKVYVPKYMYPLASCMSAYVIFLISLVDLFLVMIVMGMKITPYLLLSVVPILIAFILAYGVGMIMTTINVFFRDIEYMWDVALMLIMYTCAIFYKVDAFAGRKAYYVFKFNPLYAVIDCFRSCIYGIPMDIGTLIYALAFSVAACIIGLRVFKKHQDNFVLHI